MGTEEWSTREYILNAAKTEFLEKGFRAASLQSIVQKAGVTTGALYGYYKSKEELFDALVGEQAEVFMETFREAQDAFAGLPPKEQTENMGKISGTCTEWMVEYVYDNFHAFKLLVCCAEGTKYENLIHELVKIEEKATHDFIAVLRGLGMEAPEDPLKAGGLFSHMVRLQTESQSWTLA